MLWKWEKKQVTDQSSSSSSIHHPNPNTVTIQVPEGSVYLLQLREGTLWKRIHVLSSLPPLEDKKLWEGCLEEVLLGLVEEVNRKFAGDQKSCHGV